jgi:HTH-type transcriptional regulator/antitoxin HigA
MLAKYIREAHADYRRIRRRVPLRPLRTEAEYHRAVAMLDEIIDEIVEQEIHPLADLVEILALTVSAYEEIHVPVPVSSGPEILCALMEDHGLSPSDLPEVGSQGVVSEVFSGKRDLNVRQSFGSPLDSGSRLRCSCRYRPARITRHEESEFAYREDDKTWLLLPAAGSIIVVPDALASVGGGEHVDTPQGLC